MVEQWMPPSRCSAWPVSGTRSSRTPVTARASSSWRAFFVLAKGHAERGRR
jgi:hypothetical protein